MFIARPEPREPVVCNSIDTTKSDISPNVHAHSGNPFGCELEYFS